MLLSLCELSPTQICSLKRHQPDWQKNNIILGTLEKMNGTGKWKTLDSQIWDCKGEIQFLLSQQTSCFGDLSQSTTLEVSGFF